MPSEPTPRPVADGGTRSTELFESFPDPLLAYEREGRTDASRGPFVVRRVNPAFEAAFDVETAAGTPLDGVVLAGSVRPPPAEDGPTGATDAPGSDDPGGSGDPGGTDTTVRSSTTTAASLLERVRDAGTGVRFDWTDGGETRHFHVRVVASGAPDEAGYLVFADVTEPERERRALEGRVEHLEQVASTARHDLRNPLEVARIRLEAARDTGEDVHFEKVAGALDRIEGIAREVLATGDGSVDRADAVALGTVAEAAWETVDTADATLVTSPGLPTVRGDADQLRGLFENLFRNSVEHGSTSNRAEPDDVAEGTSASNQRPKGADDPVEHGGRKVTVTVEPTADGFAVADDGSGVPEEIRDRAFEAGSSTAPDNTGLGLSIVRRIARAHGWRVSIAPGGESSTDADGGGARFEFTGVERVEDEAGSSGDDNPDR